MTSIPSEDPRIIDDKSHICIPFILNQVKRYLGPASSDDRLSIIGLNGVQGVGKTTLVEALAHALQNDEELETLVISIDDMYLKREDQVALAASQPDNALVQVRGQPGESNNFRKSKSFCHAFCFRRRS